MQQNAEPPSAPLSDAQFRALRLWAMQFGKFRRYGVAAWPFKYTREQYERLRALQAAVPQGRRLAWVFIVAALWFLFGFTIGFLPLTPFLSAHLSAHLGVAARVALNVGIFANVLSGLVFGYVAAAWTGGRILVALVRLPPLPQASGDAELLARIRRHAVRLALFAVVAAAVPWLTAAFLLQ